MKNVNLDEVVKKYEAGATLKQLAEEYSCSIPTVSRALHAHGATVRPKGRRKKVVHKTTASEAIATVTEGTSRPKVGEGAFEVVVPIDVPEDSSYATCEKVEETQFRILRP